MTIAISNVRSLQEAREALHVSVSQLKAYLLCSQKYWFTYVLRTPPEHRPSALAFGSAVHEVLAAFYGHLAAGGGTMEQAELVAVFDAAWEGELAREPPVLFTDKETADGLCGTAHGMIGALVKDGYVPAEILGVEVPFAVPLPGREEMLVGAFDLVGRDDDGQLVVVEHKTAARRWSDDQLTYDLQASAYTWAAKELGLGDVDVVYQLLLKTKAPAIETYRVQRGEADIRDLQRIVDGVMRAVEANAYYPVRSWACSTCPYRQACTSNG